jgi:hypothetical protein
MPSLSDEKSITFQSLSGDSTNTNSGWNWKAGFIAWMEGRLLADVQTPYK